VTALADARRSALDAIGRYVNTEPTGHHLLQRTVDLLHDSFDRYSWVGVYLVEQDDLILAAWQGPQPTEHERIPIGEGICGSAAASGRTELVDDVRADRRYLACFASTRSEIVVPILHGDDVVGEIDIDSDEPAAFDAGDQAFLEHIARMVSSRSRD
jgi:L-methionine (R)-S-oxide reductase